MKKGFILACSVIFALLSVIICFAHAGGTDGSGGHYNKSTGEYHYHHGYPAHQHDNGACPYDYDDNTADTYKSTENDIAKDTTEKESTNVYETNSDVKKRSFFSILKNIFNTLEQVWICFFMACLLSFLFSNIIVSLITSVYDKFLHKTTLKEIKNIIIFSLTIIGTIILWIVLMIEEFIFS